MQTFINNQDAKLQEWPTSLTEWDNNPEPEITFTVATGKSVQLGDRILCGMLMSKRGFKSGSIVNIYYLIQNVNSVATALEHETEVGIKATVKRIEL